MNNSNESEYLIKLSVELKRAQPFLEQILKRNASGGLLAERAISSLLSALDEYEKNKGQ